MNDPHAPTGSAGFPADALSQLELTIAKHADRLARTDGEEHGKDLQHWLQAEREVFALASSAENPPTWTAAGDPL
jgi:hypothetical protein